MRTLLRFNFLKSRALIFGVLGFHAFVALLAPYLRLSSTDSQDSAALLQGPSLNHWLGTDSLGRDAFSRLLHGGRPSLVIAFAATAISCFIGFLSLYLHFC